MSRPSPPRWPAGRRWFAAGVALAALALLYHWSLGHLYYTEERSLIRWLVIIMPLAILFAPRD